MTTLRSRPDRCPGVLRPWPAADGLLIRIRLVGGRISSRALGALLDLAEAHGDGRVHVTSRANVQLRALPGALESVLPEEIVVAIEAAGLLPSREHDRARNIMVSPQTGRAGGRIDLREVARELDRGLCADPALAALPGRFLFALDDGRGDLVDRGADLAVVALSGSEVQLNAGGWAGPVVPLADAVPSLLTLARRFLSLRGTGPGAAWHVDELPVALVERAEPDARTPVPSGPLPFGSVPGGRHVEVGTEGIDRARAGSWESDEVVITPWRGVFVPEAVR